MRTGVSYLIRLAKARGKMIVTCAVVGLTMASARADIVTYDAVTGTTTWDFSTLIAVLVGVLALGVSANAIFHGIKKGYAMAKSLFR